MVKGSRGSQGLRINKVKYQIVKSAVDENSGCYSVYGKKVCHCHYDYIMAVLCCDFVYYFMLFYSMLTL